MYLGWIPNVSGYLSFSHIGGLPIRHRVIEEKIHPPTRFQKGSETVSLWQERNLSDRPELGWLKWDTAKGLHHFLLQGMLTTASSGRRCLTGVIISVPSELSKYLLSAHAGFIEGRLPIDQSLATRYSSVLTYLEQNTAGGHYALSFHLEEDGIVEMQSLANAAPSDRHGRLLALEAYSFLKDVLHKHRFHNASDDAMLELVEAQDVGDPVWYQSVIRNLHRSVIASFRSASRLAQANALGKLAYLDSFLSVLERRKIQPQPGISVATLREGLMQHQACGREEDEQKNLFVSYSLSALAIAVPVLFVGLQLLQIPCIAGLNWAKDQCTRTFEVPPLILDITASVLRQLDYVVLASILGLAALVLLLRWKHLFRYQEARTSEGRWTGDLRDIFFRLGISHGVIARLLLLAAGGGLIIGTGWIIRWLLA